MAQEIKEYMTNGKMIYHQDLSGKETWFDESGNEIVPTELHLLYIPDGTEYPVTMMLPPDPKTGGPNIEPCHGLTPDTIKQGLKKYYYSKNPDVVEFFYIDKTLYSPEAGQYFEDVIPAEVEIWMS